MDVCMTAGAATGGVSGVAGTQADASVTSGSSGSSRTTNAGVTACSADGAAPGGVAGPLAGRTAAHGAGIISNADGSNSLSTRCIALKACASTSDMPCIPAVSDRMASSSSGWSHSESSTFRTAVTMGAVAPASNILCRTTSLLLLTNRRRPCMS
jgi:hypothetical protein